MHYAIIKFSYRKIAFADYVLRIGRAILLSSMIMPSALYEYSQIQGTSVLNALVQRPHQPVPIIPLLPPDAR